MSERLPLVKLRCLHNAIKPMDLKIGDYMDCPRCGEPSPILDVISVDKRGPGYKGSVLTRGGMVKDEYKNSVADDCPF